MRRIDRILIIKGESQYGQMGAALDEMIKGFLSKGCLVTIMDLLHDDAESLRLRKDWIHDYDLIFSMNMIGLELYKADESQLKPLFWGYLEDHPFHLHSRLEMVKGEDIIVSCCDRGHVEYIDQFYPGVKWTCFMPHGGFPGYMKSVRFEDRKYDVVFIGSLTNEEALEKELDKLRSTFGNGVDLLIERVLSDTTVELETIVKNTLFEAGSGFEKENFASIMSVFSSLDYYRRFIKRKKLLEELAMAGIRVTIFGNGWEGLSERAQKTHQLMGSIDHHLIGMIMGDSRFVLNDMPVFVDGSHDRVFAAMQCGAVCVTDRSGFLEELFTNEQEIIFYNANHPENVPDVLSRLMADHNKAEKIATAGRIAAQEQTWYNLAKDIIEIAEGL